MVDKYSGQVAYAVASFGGFLGIGENFFPLPWKMLNYEPGSPATSSISTAAGSNGHQALPSRDMPNWSDRAYTGRIDEYWLPPV